MSCGLSVKNRLEHPDQSRNPKKRGIKLSFSDSDPLTLRWIIRIFLKAISSGFSRFFLRNICRTELTSPEDKALRARVAAVTPASSASVRAMEYAIHRKLIKFKEFHLLAKQNIYGDELSNGQGTTRLPHLHDAGKREGGKYVYIYIYIIECSTLQHITEETQKKEKKRLNPTTPK